MVGIFSFIRFFGRKEKILTVAVALMIVINVWLDLEIPRYMASITDVITSHGTTQEVMDESFGMVLCAVLSFIVGLGISITVGWISSSTAKRIREKEFEKVQKFSMTETHKIPTYSLITRSTNDIKQIQDFIGTTLESLIRAPIISVWAIVRIGMGHETWMAATLISIVAMVMLVVTILHLVSPYYKRVQLLNDKLNHVTMDSLIGQRVIRAFNAQDIHGLKFDEASEALKDNNVKANHIAALNVPFNGLIRNSLAMIIYWLGAFIIAGTADEGQRLELFSEMIVFATYATLALNGFRSMVQIFNVFPRAKVSLERIFEVLETDISIKDGNIDDMESPGSIEFIDVSFRYPGLQRDVIEGISFKVEPGEAVALVGSTGCGKSSLVNLIPRFYDPSTGMIKVDGIDIRDFRTDALRNRIGYVSQRAIILSGTVRDNVNYGAGSDTRTDEDIWNALEVACIKDFVETVGGLDVSLSEDGRNLSGGQKQRISIARAVCRKPSIYIFDDCFSALDFRTDLQVRSNLKRFTADSSVLLVTQRIGTARGADRILVMSKGRIVDQGTHSELLERCTIYREMAESQRGGDEL